MTVPAEDPSQEGSWIATPANHTTPPNTTLHNRCPGAVEIALHHCTLRRRPPRTPRSHSLTPPMPLREGTQGSGKMAICLMVLLRPTVATLASHLNPQIGLRTPDTNQSNPLSASRRPTAPRLERGVALVTTARNTKWIPVASRFSPPMVIEVPKLPPILAVSPSNTPNPPTIPSLLPRPRHPLKTSPSNPASSVPALPGTLPCPFPRPPSIPTPSSPYPTST